MMWSVWLHWHTLPFILGDKARNDSLTPFLGIYVTWHGQLVLGWSGCSLFGCSERETRQRIQHCSLFVCVAFPQCHHRCGRIRNEDPTNAIIMMWENYNHSMRKHLLCLQLLSKSHNCSCSCSLGLFDCLPWLHPRLLLAGTVLQMVWMS